MPVEGSVLFTFPGVLSVLAEPKNLNQNLHLIVPTSLSSSKIVLVKHEWCCLVILWSLGDNLQEMTAASILLFFLGNALG